MLVSASSGPRQTRIHGWALALLLTGGVATQSLQAGGAGHVQRGEPTRLVAAELAPGTDAEHLAKAVSAGSAKPVKGLRGWYRFTTLEGQPSEILAQFLTAQPGVLQALPQVARQHARKLIPNDALFSNQWSLLNTGQGGGVPGVDLHVTPVWDALRGSAVIIGIVDDGFQAEHPDLAPNLNAALSTNFNSRPFDPAYDYHGTMVAGIAAAAGANALGVAGVAYESSLADIRLIAGATTDLDDAAAMLHGVDVIAVKNNSWGAPDAGGLYGSVLEGPGVLMQAALIEACATGRGGLGTIFVFAGGNGGASGDDVNYDGYANAPEVIAVGALDDRGLKSDFSEPGACLIVSAPSGSGPAPCFGGRPRLVTTDLLGNDGKNRSSATCELLDRDYTQNFNGTSGAAPGVSGVAALMLQANPGLGWRDVKEILLRTARPMPAGAPGWITNSAGIRHNELVGAGLVDALAAVTLATNWQKLPALATLVFGTTNLGLAIPDDDPSGVSVTFAVSNANFRVEQGRLRLWAPHSRYGDLQITLTSPSGITSTLARPHTADDTGYYDWAFTSVRNWGESATGDWTFKLADLVTNETGTVYSIQLELLGSEPVHFNLIATNLAAPTLTADYQAPGWPCRDFVFECSTNLATWDALQTNQLCTGQSAVCTDTNAAGQPQRFYRLRW